MITFNCILYIRLKKKTIGIKFIYECIIYTVFLKESKGCIVRKESRPTVLIRIKNP